MFTANGKTIGQDQGLQRWTSSALTSWQLLFSHYKTGLPGMSEHVLVTCTQTPTAMGQRRIDYWSWWNTEVFYLVVRGIHSNFSPVTLQTNNGSMNLMKLLKYMLIERPQSGKNMNGIVTGNVKCKRPSCEGKYLRAKFKVRERCVPDYVSYLPTWSCQWTWTWTTLNPKKSTPGHFWPYHPLALSCSHGIQKTLFWVSQCWRPWHQMKLKNGAPLLSILHFCKFFHFLGGLFGASKSPNCKTCVV